MHTLGFAFIMRSESCTIVYAQVVFCDLFFLLNMVSERDLGCCLQLFAAEVHSIFLLYNVVHGVNIPQFIGALACGWASGVFPVFLS